MSVTLLPAPLASTAMSLRAGLLEPVAYVEELCDRIDRAEPLIEALLPEDDRRARLMREAADLARRWPDPADRPPLYGIPIGVKDIFRVDGFATHCGSALPPELFAGAEADVVTRAKEFGALVLGKTVTTEFAAFEPGPTRNPHNLAHTPGGSSSGSAAAVAAGYCPLAFGTQTVGSVIRPAAFCGVVGFKPSFGRISTGGVIPYSPSVDHVGLFTQDVAGMQLAASLFCQEWQPVPSSVDDRRPVLGVPEGPYLHPVTPAGMVAYNEQLATLERFGYQVRRVSALANVEEVAERHRRLAQAELAQVHAEWYPRYAALYRPRTVELIESGQQVGPEELVVARAGRMALRETLLQTMESAGIDLWACPPARGAAPLGIDTTGDPIMNGPWTHAGLPAITVPAGRDAEGLPFGLQLVGRFGTDEQVLAWAGPVAAAVAG